MKSNIYKVLFSLITLLPLSNLFASAFDTLRLEHIAFFVQDESIDFPTAHVFSYPLNFALTAEAQWSFSQKRQHAWTVTTGAGYYWGGQLRRAAQFDARIGYLFSPGRLYLHGDIGPGYAHVFTASQAYRREGNRFEAITDYGSPLLSPSAAFTLGYQINVGGCQFLIAARLKVNVDDPFGLIPLPHTFVGFGGSLLLHP